MGGGHLRLRLRMPEPVMVMFVVEIETIMSGTCSLSEGRGHAARGSACRLPVARSKLWLGKVIGPIVQFAPAATSTAWRRTVNSG